jgi:hypothetical protein
MNETSTGISGGLYEEDLKDEVVTLRAQYKF